MKQIEANLEINFLVFIYLDFIRYYNTSLLYIFSNH